MMRMTSYFEDEPGRRSATGLMTRDEGAADRRQHRQAAEPPSPPINPHLNFRVVPFGTRVDLVG
jgi:hypothetical protein